MNDDKMTLEEEIHINGYITRSFSDKSSLIYLEDLIKNITNNDIKLGFSLEEKYKSSLDLRPNVFSYDKVFIIIRASLATYHPFIN